MIFLISNFCIFICLYIITVLLHNWCSGGTSPVFVPSVRSPRSFTCLACHAVAHCIGLDMHFVLGK
jgi:hypothetical protein